MRYGIHTKAHDELAVANQRIRDLEAALESIHTMRLNWALVCPCKCSECDIFFEGIRDALPESETPAAMHARIVTETADAIAAQSETGTKPPDGTKDGDGVWVRGKWHPYHKSDRGEK